MLDARGHGHKWGLINPQERMGLEMVDFIHEFNSQIIFPNFNVLSEPFYFSLVCSQTQSLNECKRVGVKSHIP
jgi:hypothetical protein